MPATSKAQQRLMRMAYAYKKGELDSKEASQEVKDLADSMALKQLKKYAATKHEGLPDKVDDNLQPGDVGGMGPIKFPTATETGSGDVPAGQGDAEEEYEKKRRKMKHLKNFESFVNEAYDGNMSDFKYEFPMKFEEVTGNPEKAIKRITKSGKGYEVRTSTYMSEDEMKAVGAAMNLDLISYNKGSNVAITVYESKVNEGITFQELVDKYKDNPYGIGANSIEYVESENWGDSLVLRFEDNYGRKEAEAELKKMGIKAKMMSKSTADKAFKYRYELTVNESKVNEEYIELPSLDVPSTDLIEAFKQWYKDTADNWEDFKNDMAEDSVDEAAKNAQMEILANLSNEMNLVIKDRKFKVRMDLK